MNEFSDGSDYLVLQFSGDIESARKLFQQSLTQAKVVGAQEGTSIVQAALESLDQPQKH